MNSALLRFLLAVCLLFLLILPSARAADSVLVGQWPRPSFVPVAAVAATVTRNVAYVAAGTSGLLIIEVSNPTKPVGLDSYGTSEQTVGIDVVGDLAYVAEKAEGLQILDVSNPANPVRVGHFQTHAIGVQIIENTAYVASPIPVLKSST